MGSCIRCGDIFEIASPRRALILSVKMQRRESVTLATTILLLMHLAHRALALPNQTPAEEPVNAQRLRTALRALLSLNDGELNALMTGTDASGVAGTLPESTKLFLMGSDHYLDQLGPLLEDGTSVEGDLRIAQRHKWRRGTQNEGESQSLLAALREISSILKEERHQWGSSRKHHLTRTAECKRSPSGRPMHFCPSPDEKGEWKCIPEEYLCDDRADCPGREDEMAVGCLFYASIMDYVRDMESGMHSMYRKLKKSMHKK